MYYHIGKANKPLALCENYDNSVSLRKKICKQTLIYGLEPEALPVSNVPFLITAPPPQSFPQSFPQFDPQLCPQLLPQVMLSPRPPRNSNISESFKTIASKGFPEIVLFPFILICLTVNTFY